MFNSKPDLATCKKAVCSTMKADPSGWKTH